MKTNLVELVGRCKSLALRPGDRVRRPIISGMIHICAAWLLILPLLLALPAHAQSTSGPPTNIDAQRQLGESLITGAGVKPNKAEGLRLLEDAIAKGDRKSFIVLGRLLMDGQFLKRDRSRALFLVQSAARMGDFEGVESLGETLMWTGRTADDRREAERLLTMAGASGRGGAWTTLAYGAIYGKLDKAATAKYAIYVEKARALGNPQIEVVEAERYLYGLGTKRDAARTVSNLEKAAASGNPYAIKFLIKLFRDGSRPDIKRNVVKARVYFNSYGPKLSPVLQEQQSFLLQTAATQRVSDFAGLSRTARARPDFSSIDLQKQISGANWNFSVYLAQESLKRKKVYIGPVNGQVTRKTYASFQRACKKLLSKADCDDKKVLSDKTLAFIILN